MPFENDQLSEKVIGLAIEVYRQLGSGLLESAYEECLCLELKEAALAFRRQGPLPIIYKSICLDCGYKIDLLIEDRLILNSVGRGSVTDPRSVGLDIHEVERDPNRIIAQLQLGGFEKRHTAADAVGISLPHRLIVK